MTMPFNPRTATLREPFAAYMADDATVDLVRTVGQDFGWVPETVHAGGVRGAISQLSVSASPTILLVDLAGTADPLAEIGALAEVCEPETIVIAAGTVNDIRFYRELTGAGLQDYLPKPFTAEQLRDALTHAHMTLASPRGGEAAVERPQLMTAVIGVRGGVGATSIAASLAWIMAEQEKRQTALLDLDVHFGSGALSFDLEPGRGLTDAIENPGRIDGLFLERALVRASDTLAVLSAEAPINQPIQSDGAAFYQLLDEFKVAFERTVVDLPRSMLVAHPHLLFDAKVVVVVTELTLAAARDTIRLLSWLKANAPSAEVVVVGNRFVGASNTEVARKDFETSIERKVDYLIPYDQKLSVQAARGGKPLAAVGKTGKTAAAIAELGTRILAASGEEVVAAKPAPLLLRMFDLRKPDAKKTDAKKKKAA